MTQQENEEWDKFACMTKHAYEVEKVQDDYDETNSVTSIPSIPTLSIGCSVKYVQDDHVEIGTLVGVDI